MLDPIFNLLAGLLEWFYSLVPSYGFAITALTTLVLLVLSPLTYRSTKSMLAMRRVQPQVRRLQKKYKNDRERLNQEMMALYQEHNVSPLSGCLPILIQSPVFIVMFRVIRGITRRSTTMGFDAGLGGGLDGAGISNIGDQWRSYEEAAGEPHNFNPEYLHPDSELYQSLVQDNEMMFLGVDLSRSPWEVLQQSFGESLPYLGMIALVAVLGWYQQRQIQGRMTGEVSAQQQMIMRIIPWMLPIFSFTMPAGLVLYFIVSAFLRIGQQAYLTRAVYQNEALTKPIEFDDDDEDDDDDDEPENPLAALFGGGGSGGSSRANKSEPVASSRHGSRRPTTGTTKPKNRAARANKSSASSSSRTANSAANKRGNRTASSAGGESEKVSGWGRAKRSAPQPKETPAKPVSRRVTPKGDNSNRRGKK